MLLFYSYYNINVYVYSSSQVTFVERNPVVDGGGCGGGGAVGITLQVYIIRVNAHFYLYTCYLLL